LKFHFKWVFKVKQSVIFLLSSLFLISFFSKEKGKKESPIKGVHSGNGRAISPEGWRSHYALVRAADTTFAALFFVFLKKASAIEFKIFKQLNGKKQVPDSRMSGMDWPG